MSCERSRALIHAYLDAELDLVRAMKIEDHVRKCPACAREHGYLRAISAAMRDGSLYYPAPAGSSRRLHAVLAGAAPTKDAEVEAR